MSMEATPLKNESASGLKKQLTQKLMDIEELNRRSWE
jgi:hypothetical protein